MTNQKSKFFAVLLVCTIAATTLFAQVQTARFIKTAPNSNAFYEYLPVGYPATGIKYPLMIFLHGQGELGPGTAATLPTVLRNGPPKLINEGNFPTSFTVAGQTYRYIVLSPQFSLRGTSADIESIINYAIAHYAVDINRIYLTGLSMGGGVVWEFSGNTPINASRLAAILPVAGASAPYSMFVTNIANADLPVWATHNNGDPTVPAANTETYVAQLNAQPHPPNPLARKTIFTSNSHDAWSLTYNPTFKENNLNVYEWMLQYKRNFVVLAVSGLEFNIGTGSNKTINLQWKTTTELNNQGFNIQRSSDGSNFSSIAFVASNAANGSGATYSFTDNNPLAGKNYYRLEIKNNDGDKTFSDIKIIELSAKLDIRFYPNPVKTVLNILTPTPFSNAQLRIRNVSGQFVFQQVLKGGGNIPVLISSLASGVYYAEIIENGVQQKFDFIKE